MLNMMKTHLKSFFQVTTLYAKAVVGVFDPTFACKMWITTVQFQRFSEDMLQMDGSNAEDKSNRNSAAPVPIA